MTTTAVLITLLALASPLRRAARLIRRRPPRWLPHLAVIAVMSTLRLSLALLGLDPLIGDVLGLAVAMVASVVPRILRSWNEPTAVSLSHHCPMIGRFGSAGG
jgi:hypothetical protein